MISLKPPAAPSLALDTSRCQPLRSQYLVYMRKRSPAKSAASSPPVPPRISRMAFLLSSGSLGTSMSFISSSSCGRRCSAAASSSRAISLSSGSCSFTMSCLHSSRLVSSVAYSFRAAIRSSSSLYSFVRRTYRCWSAMTEGSVISVATSSKRACSPSSFSNSVVVAIYIILYGVGVIAHVNNKEKACLLFFICEEVPVEPFHLVGFLRGNA